MVLHFYFIKYNKKLPTNPNIVYKKNGWTGWYDVIN